MRAITARRRTLWGLWIGLIFALCQAHALALPTPPRVHNLTGAFLSFWQRHGAEPRAERLQNFKVEVIPTFPEFYQYKIEKWKEEKKDPDTKIDEQLQDFPRIAERFSAKAATISGELETNLKTFLTIFDDFDTGFDLYIMHSLGEMDGGTRRIGGALKLIFGIEGIVNYHNASTDVPFYHHELFHVYHAQHYSGPDLIWNYLWEEGLATYLSQVLNPGASYRDIMLDVPSGLVSQCDQKMPELWSKIDAELESNSNTDYTTWFLFSSSDPGVPKRAGYYLGYLIAREIGKGRTPKELARLSGDGLLTEIRQAIRKLSAMSADDLPLRLPVAKMSIFRF